MKTVKVERLEVCKEEPIEFEFFTEQDAAGDLLFTSSDVKLLPVKTDETDLNSDILTCDLCNRKFASLNLLTIHRGVLHKESDYKIRKGESITPAARLKGQPIGSSGGKIQFDCGKCGLGYASQGQLLRHIQHRHVNNGAGFSRMRKGSFKKVIIQMHDTRGRYSSEGERLPKEGFRAEDYIQHVESHLERSEIKPVVINRDEGKSSWKSQPTASHSTVAASASNSNRDFDPTNYRSIEIKPIDLNLKVENCEEQMCDPFSRS